MWRLLTLALVASACTLPTTTVSTEPAADAGDSAVLVRVDDGDSLVVTIAGSEQTVRLIGINAPERGECLSETARDRLRELTEGLPLTLVSDTEDADRFGRLLRYLYVDDVFVNARLAEEGLVLARPFEPNVTQQRVLEDAEDNARSDQTGIWDPEACGPVAADIEIDEVVENPPGPDLDGEYVAIVNRGAETDLTDWTIKDETSQNRFTFPAGTSIGPGETVRIYSGCGSSTSREFFWCQSNPVWDNGGDTAFLVAPNGSNHATLSYGG